VNQLINLVFIEAHDKLHMHPH